LISDLKNPTPRSLALIAAGVISALVLGSALILSFSQPNWLHLAIIFAVTFTSTYFILTALLEVFIYRKIKLIYKNMSAYKGSKERTLAKVDLNKDILGNVNQEVIDWQQNRSNEIAELKKLENFRKEFLGNVSHELKTPIFNIQGYIHTLLDGAMNDEEVNTHYLQRAVKSAERLALIVEDLESISKLEAGELILDIRTFDIHELVKDVYESSEMKALEKNIALKIPEGSNKPFYVYADKERIRQVIVNLVVNSIKYGKEKGITSIAFYDMVENILVEVTDNGIGIDMDHLPRIFERFYRVDKSRSREAGGTGLGLAIVKHIIEAHKQNINVRSTPGYGTTFAFTLKKAG
jgi:two-component system phosphate regulon sensor histidine kinase PhoR